MQCCNKHVIIYSGARVSEFIRAIRSFISIDVILTAVCNIAKLKHFVYYKTDFLHTGNVVVNTLKFVKRQ